MRAFCVQGRDFAECGRSVGPTCSIINVNHFMQSYKLEAILMRTRLRQCRGEPLRNQRIVTVEMDLDRTWIDLQSRNET